MSKLLNQTKFDEVIHNFLSDLKDDLNDPWYIVNIEDIETESRPGYMPFSHNQGGYELKAFADLRGFYGSGEHYRTYAQNFIDYLVDRDRRFYLEHNKITDKDMTPESEHDDAWFEGLGDDSNSVYLEIMAMFSDKDEHGVYTLSLNAYLEGSDAPYHRGADYKLENEIRFKTLSGLKRQLAKLRKKFRKFCMIESSKVGEFEANESRQIYQFTIRKPISEIDRTETKGA